MPMLRRVTGFFFEEKSVFISYCYILFCTFFLRIWDREGETMKQSLFSLRTI